MEEPIIEGNETNLDTLEAAAPIEEQALDQGERVAFMRPSYDEQQEEPRDEPTAQDPPVEESPEQPPTGNFDLSNLTERERYIADRAAYGASMAERQQYLAAMQAQQGQQQGQQGGQGAQEEADAMEAYFDGLRVYQEEAAIRAARDGAEDPHLEASFARDRKFLQDAMGLLSSMIQENVPTVVQQHLGGMMDQYQLLQDPTIAAKEQQLAQVMQEFGIDPRGVLALKDIFMGDQPPSSQPVRQAGPSRAAMRNKSFTQPPGARGHGSQGEAPSEKRVSSIAQQLAARIFRA